MRIDPIARNCALVLLAGILWQVFALGFYLDDWVFIVKTARADAGFSLERWHSVRLNSLPRPGLTPLWYGLTSILGDQPILWHTALLAVNILLVCLLFKISSADSRQNRTDYAGRVSVCSVLVSFAVERLLPFLADGRACYADPLPLWLVCLSCGSGLDQRQAQVLGAVCRLSLGLCGL